MMKQIIDKAKQNPKSKAFWLYIIMAFLVLLYAFLVLSGYTTLRQSQFCFNDCASDSATQSLSYVPATITVDLIQQQTKLGKENLLLAKSENEVLSVDKVKIDDQQVKYYLRNISKNTTVLVDDMLLPQLRLADYHEPVLKIGDNVLTFTKTNEQTHDLIVNVKKEKNDANINYYLMQGKVISFDDGNGKIPPNCQDKNAIRLFKKALHDANRGHRSINFGGLMICDNKIPMEGVETDVLMLRYQKKDNGYYIRPVNGNMGALHNHVIKYQDKGDGDRKWQNFKEKPFEIIPNHKHSIKMGYSKFGSVELNGEQLIFTAGNKNTRQKISNNHPKPNHVNDLQIVSLVNQGYIGLVLSIFIISCVSVIGYQAHTYNATNRISWIMMSLLLSGLVLLLIVVALSKFGVGTFNGLSFSDLAWLTLSLMFLVLVVTLYLAFVVYGHDDEKRNNQKNTRHIIMLFSMSVIMLLTVNIDYGSALNIADESNKYYNDFKTQLEYICVFLYVWLLLLVYPQSWVRALSSKSFDNKITLDNKFDIVNKMITLLPLAVLRLAKALVNKKTILLLLVVMMAFLVAALISYVYSSVAILNFWVLFGGSIMVAIFAIILVAKILSKIAEFIAKYFIQDENSQNGVPVDYFGKLLGLSFILGVLLFVQAFFGTETGVGGIFQPNELMKFILCLLISWLVISAKKSELEYTTLLAVIVSMAFILVLLNDYSYAFFILFLAFGGMLAFLYRRMFWSMDYKQDLHDYKNKFTRLPWQKWPIIVKILFVCVLLTIILFTVYVAVMAVRYANATLFIMIALSTLLFLGIHLFLYYKHRPHQQKDKPQLNSRLRNAFIVGLVAYFSVGVFTILLIIFSVIPGIPFLNEGNTAERLEVWRALLLHKETGYQLLQAYYLGFDEAEQAIQNFIKVPEIDDDFAYTGWLYGKTVGAVSFLWVAVFFYVASLLWLIREIGVMPYFRAINIKDKRWSDDDKKEIIYTAEKYQHHNWSASAFALCVLSVFMVHVVLSLSTNLNFLPVVGQPFPYLGRQGSHLILFEFLSVLVIIYFLRRHFINNHTSNMIDYQIYSVDDGVYARRLSSCQKNESDILWVTSRGEEMFGERSVEFWSRRSISAYVDNTRVGYAVGDAWVYGGDQDIKITASKARDNVQAGIDSNAKQVSIHCSLHKEHEQHKEYEQVKLTRLTRQTENGVAPLITIKAEIPQQSEEIGLAVQGDLFARFKRALGGGVLRIDKRSLGHNGEYMQVMAFRENVPAPDLPDDLSLAQWYIEILRECPDEFVLYMSDRQRQQQIGKLLREHIIQEDDFWQVGHLRISRQIAQTNQEQGNSYQLKYLLVKLSVINNQE